MRRLLPWLPLLLLSPAFAQEPAQTAWPDLGDLAPADFALTMGGTRMGTLHLEPQGTDGDWPLVSQFVMRFGPRDASVSATYSQHFTLAAGSCTIRAGNRQQSYHLQREPRTLHFLGEDGEAFASDPCSDLPILDLGAVLLLAERLPRDLETQLRYAYWDAPEPALAGIHTLRYAGPDGAQHRFVQEGPIALELWVDQDGRLVRLDSERFGLLRQRAPSPQEAANEAAVWAAHTAARAQAGGQAEFDMQVEGSSIGRVAIVRAPAEAPWPMRTELRIRTEGRTASIYASHGPGYALQSAACQMLQGGQAVDRYQLDIQDERAVFAREGDPGRSTTLATGRVLHLAAVLDLVEVFPRDAGLQLEYDYWDAPDPQLLGPHRLVYAGEDRGLHRFEQVGAISLEFWTDAQGNVVRFASDLLRFERLARVEAPERPAGPRNYGLDPAIAELEPLVGMWTGGGESGARQFAVQCSVRPILGGRALQLELSSQEDAASGLITRDAYGRWRASLFTSTGIAFQFDGTLTPCECGFDLVLEAADPDAAGLEQTRYTWSLCSGELRLTLEAGSGEALATLNEATLRRR